MLKKVFIALSLVAMVLIPVAGINAQTVAESGTNTETFTSVNSSSGDVTLTTDDANNYDSLYNFSVVNTTPATNETLVDGTDYVMNGQDVVILSGAITTDSTIDVTYGYDIYETSSIDFSGDASTLVTNAVGTVGSSIFDIIQPILMLAGVLIALFFGFKQLRRWIGGSRG